MRTHTINFTIRTKHPKQIVLYELELAMNELVEKDEDLKIKYAKNKRKKERKPVGK